MSSSDAQNETTGPSASTRASTTQNRGKPLDSNAKETSSTVTMTTNGGVTETRQSRRKRSRNNNIWLTKKQMRKKPAVAPADQDDDTYFRNKVWMKTKLHWTRFLKSGSKYNSTGGVCISFEDKAEELLLSIKDGLHVFGHKGYRSARCTHGVNSGTWYCEFEVKSAFQEGLINEIDEMHKDKANVRVGWGTRMAELQGPIGLNAYGYGYRDIGGEKLHKSNRERYGESYGPGDVVGLLIHFADSGNDQKHTNNENVEASSRSEKNVDIDHIRFFKNGVDQGIAFANIPSRSLYFPTVSLYYNAYVKFNPGPKFKFSPRVETGNHTLVSFMSHDIDEDAQNETQSVTKNNVYDDCKPFALLGERYIKKDMREEEEKFDALIFDLNGTLIDSMEHHYISYRVVCSDYDLEIDRSTFYPLFGMDSTGFISKVCELQNKKLSQNEIENISNKRLAWYKMHCLGRQRSVPCVLRILQGAKESGKLKLGLVSSESKEVIDHILKQINVNPAVFDVIVNNHDYTRQKPNPDSFLIAAKKLRVKPSRVRAYGDSYYDIMAMKNAGMDAVDVKYLKDYPNAIAKKWTRLDSLFLAYSGVVTA